MTWHSPLLQWPAPIYRNISKTPGFFPTHSQGHVWRVLAWKSASDSRLQAFMQGCSHRIVTETQGLSNEGRYTIRPDACTKQSEVLTSWWSMSYCSECKQHYQSVTKNILWVTLSGVDQKSYLFATPLEPFKDWSIWLAQSHIVNKASHTYTVLP